MFLPVVVDNTNVVASGCTGSSTKYQPKNDAYTLKQDEWVELTNDFRFSGQLHICDEKTGSGPDCGEKSKVGDGSTSHEQTDTQIPPDLSILHCTACLYYKKGSPKSCKSVPCTSDEEYYISAGIVYTDFLKVIGDTFENLSPKTRRSVHENVKKMRPSSRSRTRSQTGFTRRSRNAESEPFYCYSFTGKITDTLDFSRHLNNEEVVASGCSTPMEDEGNKRYLPSLHPHKGEGYTCNKTVEIGPNCRPPALKDDTSSPIVHGKPPTKPKPGRNPVGQGQGPGPGSEGTEEEPDGDNPEPHAPDTSVSEAGGGKNPGKNKGKGGGHGGGDSAAMTIGPASISTLLLSLISFLRLMD